jgi:hypothetical protein
MSSTDRSLLRGVEERSADLLTAVRARLVSICAEPGTHARFLNTLSLMEHIGSRKIMASQGEARLSHDTLKHLAEETRHAYFFKRAAERLAGRALDYSSGETIAGASARLYMGRLDAAIADAMTEASPLALPYLYMSLVVELRAIWFYRLYQEVLSERRSGISLASVLAEEELHLGAMLERVAVLDDQAASRIAGFADLEDKRFRALWGAIEAETTRPRVAAE